MSIETHEVLKNIDEIHLASIQSYNSASLYIQNKNYQILSIRFLTVGKDCLDDHTIHFLIYKDHFFSIEQGLELSPLVKGYQDIYAKIMDHFTYTHNIMLNYEDDIEEMEDSLFDRKIPRNFMHQWFSVKKDIAKIQRVLSRSTLVLDEFNLINDSQYGKLKVEFSDLKERFALVDRDASSKLSKLDNMYSYYNSIKSDGVNRSIYLLSLISGLFLPLNLIVGFFGMNTQGLFFTENAEGTVLVTWILLGTAATLIFFVPTLIFLDKILLRHIFGRAKHYERLIEKLKQIKST